MYLDVEVRKALPKTSPRGSSERKINHSIQSCISSVCYKNKLQGACAQPCPLLRVLDPVEMGTDVQYIAIVVGVTE